MQNPLLAVAQEHYQNLHPAHVTGVTSTELNRIRQSLDSSVSENTRASYRSVWKTFERWAQVRAALALPASPALIAAYLSHLAEERRLSVPTVRLHRAAIAEIHKSNGHQDPTDNDGVRRVLKGITRAHGRAAKQAKPLTAEGPWRRSGPQRHPGARWDKERSRSRPKGPPGGGGWTFALLSVLRDGLLRRSEAAVLTWGDEELRDNGTTCGQLKLRRLLTYRHLPQRHRRPQVRRCPQLRRQRPRGKHPCPRPPTPRRSTQTP